MLNYELEVRICDGTEEEKLEWFRVINIAGKTLTNQELLNATYTGPWLADAKNFFSKRNCVAGRLAEGYISGSPIRQDYLEKALAWIADRDGLESGQIYMALHQRDEDANDLWVYFQTVINWAKAYFPDVIEKVTPFQNWGILYNRYKDCSYNTNTLKKDVKELLLDDEVGNIKGIIPYVLSDRTRHDERNLSLRSFSTKQKLIAYERQGHKCPICMSHGVNKEYEFDEMEGDHIIPWSQGGRTTDDNLQMLCKKCNNEKGGK